MISLALMGQINDFFVLIIFVFCVLFLYFFLVVVTLVEVIDCL